MIEEGPGYSIEYGGQLAVSFCIHMRFLASLAALGVFLSSYLVVG